MKTGMEHDCCLQELTQEGKNIVGCFVSLIHAGAPIPRRNQAFVLFTAGFLLPVMSNLETKEVLSLAYKV